MSYETRDPELEVQRNDRRANQVNRIALTHWRANCDCQIVLDARAMINYITKYSTKPEKRSLHLQTVCGDVLNKFSGKDLDLSGRGAIQSILMQITAQRDITTQETVTTLFGNSLASNDFIFVSKSRNTP